MNITTVISIFPMHTIWKKFPLNLVFCQGEKKEEKKKEREKEGKRERKTQFSCNKSRSVPRQTDRPTDISFIWICISRALFGIWLVSGAGVDAAARKFRHGGKF